jgi:hypothetical protein
MTGQRSAEDRVALWLEEEAVGFLPDRVLEATFERTRETRQARRSFWRSFPMSRPIPALIAVGAAAVIVAAGVIYFRPAPSSNVGGLPPSPSPAASGSPSVSPTPTPGPIDTSAWKTYTSGQYGITIGRPESWQVFHQATRPWTPEDTPIDLRMAPYDTFTTPDQNLAVGAFAVPLDGVAVETFDQQVDWAEEFCRLASQHECAAIRARAEPICLAQLDGLCGVIVPNDEDVHAYVAHGSQSSMTVVIVWRPEDHATTRPYGGSTNLLRAFLATLNVEPG